MTSTVGQILLIPCQTSGIPVPVITWLKDSRQIQADDIKYRVETNGTLVIYSLEVINRKLLDWIFNTTLSTFWRFRYFLGWRYTTNVPVKDLYLVRKFWYCVYIKWTLMWLYIILYMIREPIFGYWSRQTYPFCHPC